MRQRRPICFYYGDGRLAELAGYQRVVLQPGFYQPDQLRYLAEQDVQALAYLSLSEDQGPPAPWQRQERNPDWGGAFVHVGHPLWVAHAVDAWFDAAYVGGDYPRDDFADAWPGFTTGAQAEAQGDKALMSNQDIGADIAGVEATARKVTVDVLAVKGKPSGATARFVLKFRTDGDVQRKVEVRGRLFLTPEADGWHIFGYDVTKGRWA